MLIPILRVTEMARAIDFYTRVLDFAHHSTWPGPGDPSHAVLTREGSELHLSSYPNGAVGQSVMVRVADVDAAHRAAVARGLDQAHRTTSPVHLGPVDQSWGNREFYASDPDGNTICYAQLIG